MRNAKIGVASVLALSLTAASFGVATAQDGDSCTVGVSWNNFQEERWGLRDEPAIQAVLDEAGAEYISTDAASSAEKQVSDVEQLINQGADVLIILAQDNEAILPAAEAALAEGIPVIAYDRLFETETPGAYYVTFDNVEVGRMQARAILEAQPTGNYVFIKGNAADPNADFLRGGQQEVLQEAIDAGDIVNVGEQYTDNWDPAVAQRNMEQILTDNNNEVDAVVASNDGTAGGAIAALTAQGLDGVVPVSGQDADNAALNRVALGTQTVTVWKDARELGAAAAELAVSLCAGEEPEGLSTFSDGPKGIPMQSILLSPTPIQQDNLQLVVDAGWISQDELCAGVEPGAVEACG
ncbi:MAG: D-xylose ABC transporter substrate-binding protein [Candidatus Limnocylindrales bacterium]